MRIALDTKVFDYFKRMDLSEQTEATLIEKLRSSGPMTRQCVLAELGRREKGGIVVRKRSS